jgi:tetratricopeptide (TPR) repeat protein
MGRKWRSDRTIYAVVALAILAGIPAVMAVVRIRSPWWLGLGAVLGAVGVALGAAWQDRYQRRTRQQDEQATQIRDGCLMVGGRLPRVNQVRDPLHLGVHPAPDLRRIPEQAESARVPVYVPRDIDQYLRELLAHGGFILLVGDATAGKSRAAYEAMLATLPEHILIAPHDRDALNSALALAADIKQCVVWLDDLESYLGGGALTRTKITGLVAGEGQHKVILATLRAAEDARYTSDMTAPEAARQAHRNAREVLELAHRVRIPRLFTGTEQERARARDWDPRIADALTHADVYGIAEYLAAGPELLRKWENAWNPNTDADAPTNPRGAALVMAAVDIRRAGWTAPVPVRLLGQVHHHYLAEHGGARLHPESLAAAWHWARQPGRATTALLQAEGDDHVQVFDYLVDVAQRRTPAGDHVREDVVRAAVDAGDPADADALGATAYTNGRYGLGVYAYRRAYERRAADPGYGPEHPDTLTSRDNLADALRGLGRLEEAEAEHRAVLSIRTRTLGEEHPSTLTTRANLARVLRARGRLREAEAEHRAVPGICHKVLGPEHPDTLASQATLARMLQDLGRLDEAEAVHRAVLSIRNRTLGEEHPSTLASRGSLASVLHYLGRYAEAESEHRTVLEIRVRVLGAEHPRTLTSRGDLARVLHDLGRLEEAATEQKTVLAIRERVLGPEHPRTLASRGSLASVVHDLGRLAEAEAEHAAVLTIRTRVLGPEHPRTLTSRNDLARARHARGRLDEAEKEHRAVLDIRVRTLGPENPDSLTSRSNLAGVLEDLGRLVEAAGEHAAVLDIRTRVLGPEHPRTLASKNALARIQQVLKS